MKLYRFSIGAGLLAAAIVAAQTVDFDGRPALLLQTDKLELTVLSQGGTMANLLLRDDASKLSPFWNSERALRPNGPPPARPGNAGSLGHFLCLDGFGTPSAEERAAGYPTHGEANRQQFEVVASGKQGDTSSLKISAKLPLAQEAVTRTISAVDGENVVYVSTEVESLVAFDRPFSWAEHATVGPPFLNPGTTVIDASVTRCRVRAQKAGSTGKIAYDKDFVWPNAPLTKGGTVDLTAIPAGETSLDLAACQVDPARTYGYIAVVRPDKHMIFGYVFRRVDYPWLMNWMNYTGDARASRGVEFSTQPFDISHRESTDAHDMFGTPTFKWLPAKAKVRSSFLLFYTRIPDGFPGVADVTVENGQLMIRDKAGKTIAMPARLPL